MLFLPQKRFNSTLTLMYFFRLSLNMKLLICFQPLIWYFCPPNIDTYIFRAIPFVFSLNKKRFKHVQWWSLLSYWRLQKSLVYNNFYRYSTLFCLHLFRYNVFHIWISCGLNSRTVKVNIHIFQPQHIWVCVNNYKLFRSMLTFWHVYTMIFKQESMLCNKCNWLWRKQNVHRLISTTNIKIKIPIGISYLWKIN